MPLYLRKSGAPSGVTRTRNLFLASLAAFVVLYWIYGLKRFTLGVDFTDEGAYLAWPMRMFFGEPPFSSEIITLGRPIEVFLSFIYRIHPAITLYEARLLGWVLHLAAFCVLSTTLFRLSGGPFLSPLIASLPFFVCHIFGLAPPSYNSLSSDFLLIALGLQALASLNHDDQRTTNIALHFGAGLALFIATLAHPALGLIALMMIIREVVLHKIRPRAMLGTLTPSSVGIGVFLLIWFLFGGYLVASGSLARWLDRATLTSSFTLTSIHTHAVRFFYALGSHLLAYSQLGVVIALASLTATGALCVWSIRGRNVQMATAATLLALLLITSFVFTTSFDPEFITSAFAFASLLLASVHVLGICSPQAQTVNPTLRFLLLLSIIASFLYATTTYFFSPHRSWVSGILALPFAFSVGLVLLLRVAAKAFTTLRLLVPGVLGLAVTGLCCQHFYSVQRDASPPELTEQFRVPKLRNIHSTPERTAAVNSLFDLLHSRLSRGEPLLVFDDAPMLYYIFDAMPAYGMTWARRYGITQATLKRLDDELRSHPLPRYAIRMLVDVSNPVWSVAPRTNYDKYPLNETVMANYELQETIFPFEIWRLRNELQHSQY